MTSRVILLVVAIILVAVAAGVGVFVMNEQKNKQAEASPAPTTSEEPTPTPIATKSIKDLMALTDQMCTFRDPQTNATGTAYIGTGRMRGDFTAGSATTATSSATQQTHMISDGKDMYIWMDGTTQGYKMSLAAVETATNANTSAVDINKQVEYSCSSWIQDATKFTIPRTVRFQDMSSLLQSLPQSTRSGTTTNTTKAAQCAQCATLPAEARAQCQVALQCN